MLSSTSFTYEYKSSMDSVAISLTHILILDKTADFPLLLFKTLLVIAHWETEIELIVCGSAACSLSACGEEAAMQCDHFLWPFFLDLQSSGEASI